MGGSVTGVGPRDMSGAPCRWVVWLMAAVLLASCETTGRQPPKPAAAVATAAVAPAAVAPAAVAPVAADPQPQLVIETGAHSAFVRRISVAGRSGTVITASDDKTARVWNLATGELRQVLRPAIGPGEIGRLYGVAAHPTDDLVAVGGTTGQRTGEHRILIFSISSGLLLRSFDARGGDIKKLAWSPDGSVLLAVYAGGHALRAFDADGILLHEHLLSAPSYGLAVASDGTTAASSFDGQVLVLKAGARRVSVLQSFRTRTAEPVGLAFSPDASRLVAGFRTPEQAPEVYEAASGRYLFKLEQPKVEAGSHRTVAWSEDGKTIAVGGSGYTPQRNFPVFFHDAFSGRLSTQQDVGKDTIYDLVALPGGRFAYASGDGSWGVVGPGRLELSVRASIADLKGAGSLYVDNTGSRVGWSHSWGREPADFDFTRRVVSTDATASARKDMLAPKARRNLLDAPVWENSLRPQVNGRPFALGDAEVSRALAYFRSGSDAILGTSHRLLRIGTGNKVLWEVRNADEVRSVNVTGDDRMIVTGMSDGTLRWWRASDGEPLMSLLATADRRWVVWTPEGYFDASAGADRLVGWTVNRGLEPAADHHSLNRFRERFNRPDLIDQVLRTATPVAGLDPAAVLRATAQTPPENRPAPQAAIDPPPKANPDPTRQAAVEPALRPAALPDPIRFPPVVAPINLADMQVGQSDLKIPIVVRAEHEVRMEVRVDGRPVDADFAPSPAASGSKSAVATVPRPSPGSLVQVLAKDNNGVSEPSVFLISPGPDVLSPNLIIPVGATEPPAVILPAGASSSLPKPPDLLPVEPPERGLGGPLKNPASTAPSSSQTRLYVLAIGISDYQRPEYKLGLAAKDAKDFAEAMARQSGKLYREVLTRTLVNSQATLPAIVANLKWLSDTVEAGGRHARFTGCMLTCQWLESAMLAVAA